MFAAFELQKKKSTALIAPRCVLMQRNERYLLRNSRLFDRYVVPKPDEKYFSKRILYLLILPKIARERRNAATLPRGEMDEVGHGTRAKVRLEASSVADCAKIKGIAGGMRIRVARPVSPQRYAT